MKMYIASGKFDVHHSHGQRIEKNLKFNVVVADASHIDNAIRGKYNDLFRAGYLVKAEVSYFHEFEA